MRGKRCCQMKQQTMSKIYLSSCGTESEAISVGII